ncbi:unnamed protein product [Bemisia tabaci]|uniref:Uncharacterized protein n=1 Tax=Bemisia tabaci TaxID=7038 RepID=A0A9P0F532_BEMTA|nr:unnamed protein product [Bemisia tabaci]
MTRQHEQNKIFQANLKIIDNLKSVNDTAERGVKLVEEYSEKKLTRDEKERQHIIQVVAEHRKQYPDPKINENKAQKRGRSCKNLQPLNRRYLISLFAHPVFNRPFSLPNSKYDRTATASNANASLPIPDLPIPGHSTQQVNTPSIFSHPVFHLAETSDSNISVNAPSTPACSKSTIPPQTPSIFSNLNSSTEENSCPPLEAPIPSESEHSNSDEENASSPLSQLNDNIDFYDEDELESTKTSFSNLNRVQQRRQLLVD